MNPWVNPYNDGSLNIEDIKKLYWFGKYFYMLLKTINRKQFSSYSLKQYIRVEEFSDRFEQI
jgi:hypothetical protein